MTHDSLHRRPVLYRLTRLPALILLFVVLLAGLSGCGEKTDTLVAAGGYSTLYEIDTTTNTALWTRTVDCTHTGLLQDGDIVYFGTADGIITAISAESGETLWEQQTSFGSPFMGWMDSADGVLYYTGNDMDIGTRLWQIFALDLETMEETALNIGNATLQNFSVYQGQLYACTGNGFSVYNLETGETAVWDLPRSGGQYMATVDNLCIVGYKNDKMEWYKADSSGLTLYRTLDYDDLYMPDNLRGTRAVAANDEVAVLIEYKETSDDDTGFYAYLTDKKKLITYDRIPEWPGYVTFVDDGFYAVLDKELRYYDFQGNWQVVAVEDETISAENADEASD